MSAVPKLAHRDRPSPLYRNPTPGADVIQFPTSVRTRRERQQLIRGQLSPGQLSAPLQAPLQRQSQSRQSQSRQSQSRAIASSVASNSVVSSNAVASNAVTVRSLPNVQAIPAWLQVLTAAQRTSSVVAFVLVAAVLSVYGWTVQTQQAWGRDYRRLELLQHQERQLTTTNEVLKHQLAVQAENSATGLVPSTPENAIFLEPAPPRPAPVVIEDASSTTVKPIEPLGY